jgi:hypothetical protein
MRSLWVSVLLYAGSIGLRELLDPNNARDFDFTAFRALLVQTLPWFGGFFAAVYVALYARFSSQWTYLAGLYNQIMATAARPDHDQRVLASWKAGFIEDAEDLHLALKPMYAAVIKNLATERDVVAAFIADTAGGAARLAVLLKDVDRVFGDIDRRWNNAKAAPAFDSPKPQKVLRDDNTSSALPADHSDRETPP